MQLELKTQIKLQEQGISVRVISRPSWELYEQQSQSYKDSVILPHAEARLAIEMGSTQGWHQYVGRQGHVMGILRMLQITGI